METSLKYQKLAQIDLANAAGAGIPEVDIARMLKLAVRTLHVIRKKPAYLAIRYELSTGLPLSQIQDVKNSIQRRKEMLAEMVPSALRVIVQHLQSAPSTPKGKELQMRAAIEVLDREGSLAKVSKSEIHAEHTHTFDSTDGVSKELLDAMGAAPERGAEEIAELIKVNSSFAKSETLTPQEQEKALQELEKKDYLLN